VPRAEHTDIAVGDLTLIDPPGQEHELAGLPGVQVVVLMRHRH
jgi:hypothetical protein